MIIRMVLTGHELLDGRTADVNAHFVGAELRARGSRLASVEIVPDGESGIVDAVARAARDADLVIVSGGMGPTDDDNTRHAVATAAGVELVERADVRARLVAKYAARGRTPTAASFRQALIPEGADLLASDAGTADCFSVRVGKSRVVALPGVPAEFRALMRQYVLPEVAGSIVRRRLVCFGTGEAELAARVEPLERPASVELSWRIDRSTIVVEISGEDRAMVDSFADSVATALREHVVLQGDGSVAGALVAACRDRGLRLACAESCTGGAISSAITDVPGASAAFDRGLVVYANAAKIELLGVREDTLATDGAVSRSCALQMVGGLLGRHGCDVAIAVTGIAGPGSDASAKPVGLVHIAVGTATRRVAIGAHVLNRTRDQFKEHVSTLALVAALRVLNDSAMLLRHVATVHEVVQDA